MTARRFAATFFAALAGLALSGCASGELSGGRSGAGGDIPVFAFAPSDAPTLLALRLAPTGAASLDTGEAAAIAPARLSALYRSFDVAAEGAGLDAAATAALGARLAGGAPAAAVLVALRMTIGGVTLPEAPLALLAPDEDGGARVLRLWRLRTPTARADAPVSIALAARPARGPAAAAEVAAAFAAVATGFPGTADGGAESPSFAAHSPIAAPLAAAGLTARSRSAGAALDAAFGPAAPIGATLELGPTETLSRRRIALAAGAAANGPSQGLTLALTPAFARSRLETDQPALAALSPPFAPTEPALGFGRTAAADGLGLLQAARYPAVDADGVATRTLEASMRAEGGAVDRAFAALSTSGSAGSDALLIEQCRVLRDFWGGAAGLTPIDQIAATVETLAAGGRTGALFSVDACLGAAERPTACAAGLLSCGSAAAAVDEAEAIRRLVDFMRSPTPDRRAALQPLLPERLTIVDAHLATGAPGPIDGRARLRLDRSAALDLLARARLNRYGEAAANPNDPEWWMTNFTRRPELARVITLYAAFEAGRFDDLGFVEARVDRAALSDARGWAAVQLGPLIVPCNATEIPSSAITPALRASRTIGDCAAFDDFALGAAAALD